MEVVDITTKRLHGDRGYHNQSGEDHPAVYLLNRTPTTRNPDDATPYRRLTGAKPLNLQCYIYPLFHTLTKAVRRSITTELSIVFYQNCAWLV